MGNVDERIDSSLAPEIEGPEIAMTPAQFEGTILDGHKGTAIEVPFDPAARWGIEPRRLWPGRRGHRVDGTLNGRSFEGAIVPRSRTYFLLIESAILRTANVAVGDTVSVVVQPQIDSADSITPKKKKPGRRLRN